MSAMQRIHVRTTVVVDRATADVLRLEAEKVAMFEHDLFEDFLDFCPEAQHSLTLRYRSVFDLIDALGWDPDSADPTKRRFKVSLTEDLITSSTTAARIWRSPSTIASPSTTTRSHPKSSKRSPPTASPA